MTILIDIQPNPNLEEPANRIFKEAGPAREIHSIEMPFGPFEGTRCAVTGWSPDSPEGPCPVYCQKIEDSRVAFAFLIYGGSGGLRLKPWHWEAGWDVADARQWGTSYFVIDSDSYVS